MRAGLELMVTLLPSDNSASSVVEVEGEIGPFSLSSPL